MYQVGEYKKRVREPQFKDEMFNGCPREGTTRSSTTTSRITNESTTQCDVRSPRWECKNFRTTGRSQRLRPMTIPGFHLGLQLDIYALFNRPELSRISETNRRVNEIIEKSSRLPRMVFDYVYYKSIGDWKCSDGYNIEGYINVGAAATPMSDSQIAQLSTSKFLRFRHSEFMFAKENPLDMLEAHKHLWIDNRLTVLATDFWCSTKLPQLASLVNTSHNLNMFVPGALDMLSNLFLGSITDINIIDNCFPVIGSNSRTTADSISNYTKQLPVDDINNFLFNKVCIIDQCRPFRLKIKTNYTPENCQKVVDSIKEKFLDTPDPAEFHFTMSRPTGWLLENWTLEHKHSKKELHYICSRVRVDLYC
ncbi:hypothetical protein Ddc_22192 [Ditylenchus destructor]|nr:hypothetical protein Ddc_22192 [Ditylenchus destructor]